MGLTIFSICLKIDVVFFLRELKCPLRIVMCMESPCKLKFTDTSSAGRTARKTQVYIVLSVFNWTFNHSNMRSTDVATNRTLVLNMGTFFWLTR